MSLEQWVANAWLKRVRPSPQDVANLLAIADREIGDASLDGISTDGRFTHAYDAARSLAEAALHASGYDPPKGPQQHQRVIDSLRFTVLNRLQRFGAFELNLFIRAPVCSAGFSPYPGPLRPEGRTTNATHCSESLKPI